MKTFHPFYEKANISGRYITLADIEPILQQLHPSFTVAIAGTSVWGQPIYTVKVGEGKQKIIMWSQMHGNESTTTKALMDFILFLESSTPQANEMRRNFTFLFLPILNPDGAKSYTRVNANQVDLNRDALQITQPESQILRELVVNEKPDFAFNLHDQRTIFAAGPTHHPATLSFLAPAFDADRNHNSVREQVMQVIVAIQKGLENELPNQIGRFDDAFNANCIGDYLTTQHIPTVLFEAGHFPEDYEREMTRTFVFRSLVLALEALADHSWKKNQVKDYWNIPENSKRFCDILIRNKNHTQAFQYKEILTSNAIYFQLEPCENTLTSADVGHMEWETTSQEILDINDIIENLPLFGCDIQSNGVIVVNNLLKNKNIMKNIK